MSRRSKSQYRIGPLGSLALVIVLALPATSCGGDDGQNNSGESASPTGSAASSAVADDSASNATTSGDETGEGDESTALWSDEGWSWAEENIEPFELDITVDENGVGPDVEAIGEHALLEGNIEISHDPNEGDPIPEWAYVDPCDLITLDSWRDWVGTSSGLLGPIYLDEGEACGFIGDDDQVRFAIGTFYMEASSEPFIPTSGEGAPDVRHSVDLGVVAGQSSVTEWFPGYPSSDSNIMVVTIDSFEIIVEISNRSSKRNEAALRSAAERFAREALEVIFADA